MRRGLFLNFSLVLASVVSAVGLAEVGVRFLFYSPAERALGAETLWMRYKNAFTQEMSQWTPGCTFSDSLVAHPYLGYVLHRSEPCGTRANNRGMDDFRDFPPERDPNYFTILLTGGSVAQNLVSARYDRESFLGEILNRQYKSPNGKPFRVLSGALGGWQLPRDNVMVALYGDSVDAVISVNGYNEGVKAGVSRLDEPDWLSYFSAAQPRTTLKTLIGLELLKRSRRAALSFLLSRHSFLAFRLYEVSMRLFETFSSPGRAAEELQESFSLPASWPVEKKLQWNRARYENYVRLLKGEADALHLRYAQFVQPMPLIDKELTEEEKRFPRYVSKELYANVFLEAVKELSAQGYPIFSLTDVFKDRKETIYSDHIHCQIFQGGSSPGYELMSRRIASDLAKAWNLVPRR